MKMVEMRFVLNNRHVDLLCLSFQVSNGLWTYYCNHLSSKSINMLHTCRYLCIWTQFLSTL